MIYCKNGTITLYEGDTGTLEVEVTGDIRTTDVLEFRIKETLDEDSVLYSSRSGIENNKFIIDINKDVTKMLSAEESDKTYYYGFKLYRDEERIDTILPLGKIKVKRGV